jgi:hypothetical protein
MVATMSDLIHDAQRAKALLGDVSLPKSERLSRALQASSELIAADLADEERKEFESAVAMLTAVLDCASAETAEDDQRINDAEVQQALDLVDDTASQAIKAEMARIVVELAEGVDELPEATIREVREHRDLMVPQLIEVLREAVAGALAGEPPEGNAHFFAAFLLTEFKAEQAFPVLIEAFSLPDELPHELFGDAVYFLPPRVLALFAGDRLETIQALIDDRTVNRSVRWGAAESYLRFVRDGRMSRGEAVRRLQAHLRQAIDRNDEEQVTGLVCELSRYGPAEAMDDIREAFKRQLVDSMFIGLDDLEKSATEGEAGFHKQLEWRGPTEIDTLEELRDWACFQKRPAPAPSPEPPPVLLTTSQPPSPHFASPAADFEPIQQPIVSRGPRVGRNDPCPCGSGKKFKKCCGAPGT